MSVQITYRTITGPSEAEFKDRGSKFLAYVAPISSREQALFFLNEIKDLHKKARHHCLAWRIGYQGEDFRISDDGEPSGSAGQPIYNQLLSFDVTNIVAIVVRYFGGTKLGVPGLINAYKSSTYEALSKALIEEFEPMVYCTVEVMYDHAARLLSAFKNENIEVIDAQYADRVLFKLKMPAYMHQNRIDRALATGFDLAAVEMVENLDANKLTIQFIENGL